MNGTTSVVFQVMTCSDATVELLQKKEVYSGNMYEIVIGAQSNTRAFIR